LSVVTSPRTVPRLSARLKNDLAAGQVTLGGQQHVDDLAMLVDRPVQVRPQTGDLDVGLVNEPPVTHRVPSRSRRFDELDREPLHPPVDTHAIDRDTVLGE
jgi:hypothetical protein